MIKTPAMELAKFLRSHAQHNDRLLLAFSGGIDSMALFQSMLHCRSQHLFAEFAVAHIDHGWRTRSAEEANKLADYVKESGVIWHCKRLDPALAKGNLEESCRKERLNFFEELCQNYHYRAVLLAHHADDQAETILKRVFEGANLTALKGMQETSGPIERPLWRPFLNLEKKVLSDWVTSNGWPIIDDETNRDKRYLRARMRLELIPLIQSSFGKQITSSLIHLAQEAAECTAWLDQLCAELLAKAQIGPLGALLNCQKTQLPPIALRHALRKLLSLTGCTPLSRQQLELASQHLLDLSANREYSNAGCQLYIDRGYAFAAKQALPTFEARIPLTPGRHSFPPWEIELTVGNGNSRLIGWQRALRGELQLTIAPGDYYLARYLPKEGKLNAFWSKNKVPAFIREVLPVVWSGSEVAYEFLSGRPSSTLKTGWHLTLRSRA